VIKKVCLIKFVLIVGLWSNISFAGERDFKPGSESDGFRGIKWGTDVSTLPDMIYDGSLNVDYKGGAVCKLDCYRKKEDKLQIGEANVERILYVFHKNKFGEVLIEIKG